MIKLYPEQLNAQLNKALYATYILLGNDPLLLQESQDAIHQMAITQNFNEHHIIQIDNNTDWKIIFSLCQSVSLFSSRQTLTLILPESGLNTVINEQLTKLVGLLHNDILLTVRGNKLIKKQENATWLNHLNTQAVLVICQTPEQAKLQKWLTMRARKHGLQIDQSACELLCYYYEGNLLALAQLLDQFTLIWPDGILTLSRVEKIVNDAAHFTPLHWINALLAAKSKRALHILQYFYREESDPIILLHILRRELLFLITIKRKSATTPLHILFDKNQIWHARRALITEAANRLSHDQLRQAIHLLTQAYLTFKQNYSYSVWNELEIISLILCHKTLTDFLYKNCYYFH